MPKAIFDAVRARISVKKFVLILIGLALILLAIGWL